MAGLHAILAPARYCSTQLLPHGFCLAVGPWLLLLLLFVAAGGTAGICLGSSKQ